LAILSALQGMRGAIVSFSYRNLLDVLIHTCLESLTVFGLEPGKDYIFSKGDMLVNLRGTEILFRSGDDPERLRGLNLSYFLLDEAREFPDKTIFEVLLGRLREGDHQFWAMASTTKGRNWMYDLVTQEGLARAFETGTEANDNCSVVIQASSENSFLPRAYLDELTARYSSQLAQQELFGQIVDWSQGVFMRPWFDRRDLPWKPAQGVRFWDLATSIKTSADYSAGVLLARNGAVTNVVGCIRVQSMYNELRELIIQTAMADGPGIVIGLEQVGMQLAIVQDLLAEPRLAGYKVTPVKPKGDKFNRILPLTSRFEAGTLRLCAGPWNGPYVDEMCSISSDMSHEHDDQADATAGAWGLINCEPIVKVMPIGTFGWPAEYAKVIQHYQAVEIHEYKAYIVTAMHFPYRDELLYYKEQIENTVQGMIESLSIPKGTPAEQRKLWHRVGSPELDSDQYKSLATALIKAKLPTYTTKLDPVGAAYSLNQMVSTGRGKQETALSCMAAAMTDTDEPGPWTRAVLRIVQETRSAVAPIPKSWQPFEKQRIEYRRKQQDEQSKKEGWVNA
jgi:predicted phage terminase large subunit-like protein